MIVQTAQMAWESILSNKMRSFLTMLGIIIGVMALVVMVSLVSGATGAVTDEISSIGNDLITVTITDDKGNPLRLENLDVLKAEPSISSLAPSSSLTATAKYGYQDTTVSLTGTTSSYLSIQGLQLESGRFLKTTDVENHSYVAVLSHDAAAKLFSSEDPVGKSVSLNGRNFLVVGTLEEDESMMSAMMSSTAIYVPYPVAARMSGQPYITSFSVAASHDTDEAERIVTEYLYQRFEQDEDAYSVMNMSSISSALDNVTSMLTLLLGGIAAISLLVGGIGIMNIMLVSVTERTREIGIRKAIGAGRGSILMQFLLEALMLSLLGCLFGLLLSKVILIAVTRISGSITFSMSSTVVHVAVLFSSAIGLVFGLYPANKAAKKNPIEALRYSA